MVDVTVEVKGLSELEAGLRELGLQTGVNTLRNAGRFAWKTVAEEIAATAPEGTETRTRESRKGGTVTITPGFLRSRVKVRTRLNKRGETGRGFGPAGVVRVQAGVFRVPYVGHVEFGTRNMKARPFIRQAFINKSEAALSVFQARLKNRIEFAARKARKANK